MGFIDKIINVLLKFKKDRQIKTFLSPNFCFFLFKKTCATATCLVYNMIFLLSFQKKKKKEEDLFTLIRENMK